MHQLYTFHFLNTVSAQLYQQLVGMTDTPLNQQSLNTLAQFQTANGTVQGVYVLHKNHLPVYVGKASNMKNRLQKHLNKIQGRKNINIADIGYKALLLDKSMSTAASETVLLNLYQQAHTGMWNNGGFGPNDPGKERDTTEPGDFDSAYPIQEKWPVTLGGASMTVGELLRELKAQLPYVCRYQPLTPAEAAIPVALQGVPHEADALFEAAVLALGAGWRGAVLSYGMVLYKNQKQYPFASAIYP